MKPQPGNVVWFWNAYHQRSESAAVARVGRLLWAASGDKIPSPWFHSEAECVQYGRNLLEYRSFRSRSYGYADNPMRDDPTPAQLSEALPHLREFLRAIHPMKGK